MSDEDDRKSFWCLRLSAEGSGVTVEGSASFPEEVDTASVADIKVAIDEDDDCGVDLFGEETEEEKKAAEGHAVAVKASGKKKECESGAYKSFETKLFLRMGQVPWLLILKERRRCLTCRLETVTGYWR
ncbi:hypothetical protein Hanom_Chr06g00499851 [Helianthus anomalus]